MESRFSNALIMGLIASAVVLIHITQDLRSSPQVGDFLSDVHTIGAEGTRGELRTGRPTIVLVFSSTCRWCTELGPQWARLLRQNPDVSIVAVTPQDYAVGRAFADSQAWDVEVRTVRGRRAGALTRRTPWLFVLSADGTVDREAYGGDLETILSEWPPAPHAPALTQSGT